MAFGFRRPFQPKGDNRFLINLGDRERAVVRTVCEELIGMLDDPAAGPLLRRVYPVGHASDAGIDAAYQELVHEDLATSRRANLELIVATAADTELDRAQLDTWMVGLTTVRLVLGTRLGVTEDGRRELEPDDEDLVAHAVYEFLGGIVESIVRSLASTL